MREDKISGMNEELVKKIQAGTHAIENNGTLEELREVLKECYPKDESIANMSYQFSFFEGQKRWNASNTTKLFTIKVTDFFAKEDKLKSDGGSNCPYYMITLPKEVLTTNENGSVTFQVKDIINYALGNDFDKGNIFKALVRLGTKEGVEEHYDLKKIAHTAKEMLDRCNID